jgi:hypothetical protein
MNAAKRLADAVGTAGLGRFLDCFVCAGFGLAVVDVAAGNLAAFVANFSFGAFFDAAAFSTHTSLATGAVSSANVGGDF